MLSTFKQIYDSVHGFIPITLLACRIINTVEFQRLRYLHQLGTCHYVFQSATHSRFEHCVGTYYLAGVMLDRLNKNTKLKKKTINEYLHNLSCLKDYYKSQNKKGLDDFVCELVKIAALCHDLGHGPFSHVYDDIFLPKIRTKDEHNLYDHHEYRSGIIFERIVKKDNVLSSFFTDPLITFVKRLINPEKEDTGFIFQIVSNSVNGLDVDKYDYMTRDTQMIGLKFGFDYRRFIDGVTVINNNICYPEKTCFEVASVFNTRYRLHKQIYTHKSVIAIQMMISDMMLQIHGIIDFDCKDIDNFCTVNDSYVLFSVQTLYSNINRYTEEEQSKIKKAYELWLRINRRELYKLVDCVILDKLIEYESTDKICVVKKKIGYVGGDKHPFDDLYFFKDKDCSHCYKIDKSKISFMISDKMNEYFYMFFVKDVNDKESINKIQTILRSA